MTHLKPFYLDSLNLEQTIANPQRDCATIRVHLLGAWPLLIKTRINPGSYEGIRHTEWVIMPKHKAPRRNAMA